jgi:hypothetical protein
MSHSSDMQAKSFTGGGVMNVGRARIRGVHVLCASGSPHLQITDGSGGTTILDVKFSTSSATSHTIFIPEDGILSVNDPFLVETDIDHITVFYA